jgi:putative addiction module component (TIGR02574 family)
VNNVYEEVANAALTLPAEDRAMLADDLVASLEASQAEIDEAWRIEIERRIKEIKEGKVQLIPGEQVMSDLRAQLKR